MDHTAVFNNSKWIESNPMSSAPLFRCSFTAVKGEKAEIGQRSPLYTGPGSAGITTSCKNIELAARFLDFGYSEEGNMLYNFGIEGESYDLVDGKPVVSRLITENPDGLTVQQVSALYNRAWQDGSFVQLKERQTQVIGTSQQLTTMDRWIDSDASLYQMPPVTVAEEDISEYSKLMSEINTYVSEMMVKYISGLESLDTFEEYQATLKKMGVDRAIELQQAAYDSFNGQ